MGYMHDVIMKLIMTHHSDGGSRLQKNRIYILYKMVLYNTNN